MTQSTTGQQLTQLTTQTTGLTNTIRNRITVLNDANRKSPQGDPGFNTRKLQIANLQNSFKRALEEYNLVEKRSREKYRDRMARQIKIGASWDGSPRRQDLRTHTCGTSYSQARRDRRRDPRRVGRLAGWCSDLLAGSASFALPPGHRGFARLTPRCHSSSRPGLRALALPLPKCSRATKICARSKRPSLSSRR